MAPRFVKPTRVSVKAFARLHFGLANLSALGGRVNGGAGLMIQPSNVEVVVQRDADVTVTPSDFQRDVEFVVRALGTSMPGRVSVHLGSSMRWHYGMGLHTQLLLALATALSIYHGIPADPSTLGQRVLRGGTSGIGVHGFWNGGVLVDGGRRRLSGLESIQPSSSIVAPQQTPLVFRVDSLPFKTVVVHARNWPLVFGKLEERLFSDLTPIPPNDANRVARLIFQDLASATATGDFSAFCEALEEIQTCGFKQREIAYRGASAQSVAMTMRKAGLNGVGMSSWGPTWYGFASDHETALTAIRELSSSAQFEAVWLADVAPCAQVRVDDGPVVPVSELQQSA